MFLAFLFRLAELRGVSRSSAPKPAEGSPLVLRLAWLLAGILLPTIFASLVAIAASHQFAIAWPAADHGTLLWAFRIGAWALSYLIAGVAALLLIYQADQRLPVRRAAASPAGR